MHRRALTLFLAALAAGTGLAPARAAAPAGAAPAPPVGAEVRTLREQVSEASAEEAGLLDRLDEIQARRRRLDAKVAAVDAQLAAVQHDVDAAESRLEAVQGEFVRAQTRLALTTDELAAARNKLRRRAVSAYVGGGPSGAADLVLRAGSLRQVAASVGYLQSLVAIDRQSVARYGTLRDATAHLRVPAEAAKDAAKAQRDVVIDRQAALQAVRADHDAVRQDVLAQEDGQQLLIAEVRSRRNEFEAQIAALGVESGSVASLLRGIQGGQTPVVAGSGVLVAPIPGARITSGFGPRVHPILGTVRMHDGIDYAAAMGTPIRAAGSGTVVSAGPRGGYGNATLVDHGRGLATLVAHQSAMYVTAGTAVVTGQVIGAVGSTGFSTGPHLHFEVRVEGTPVDPLLYL